MANQNKYQRELFGKHDSMFRLPSQPESNRSVGEISNTPANSHMNFIPLSQTSSSLHDKVTQPQELISTTQVFKHSLVESTVPQITQTIVAGECCTECCPVAAAQAAKSVREMESNRITDK